MRKKIWSLALLFFVFFGTITLTACDNTSETYTTQEVVLETKACLKEKYNLTRLYSVSELPTTYNFENKYKTYIEWSSADNSIVDIANESIYRNLQTQNCILTATVYYKDAVGTIDLSFYIPPNLYKTSAVQFSLSEEVPIAVRSLSYVDYEGYYELSATLCFLNNIAENRTLKSITFSFYIYDDDGTKLTYEKKNETIQFNNTATVFYRDSVDYSISISKYYMANRIELTTHTFYISATIEDYTTGIGYGSWTTQQN